MKHFHFEPETDGFYGAYWENTTQTDAALIVMLGDDPEDHMCKACVRWLQNDGFNVLSMSPAKKDYGHHNYPHRRRNFSHRKHIGHHIFRDTLSGRFHRGQKKYRQEKKICSYLPDMHSYAGGIVCYQHFA